jgi:hypothetical protein
MDLPEPSKENIESFFDEGDLRKELMLQISKDFEMSGLVCDIDEKQAISYQKLLKEIESLIRPLFGTNSQRLFAMLYRIDVSEREIALAGLELPDFSHTQILAHLVIKRELKKVLIRKYYKTD